MILNLTQHAATDDQLEAGVVEPRDKARIQGLLTFEDLPEKSGEIHERAQLLSWLAELTGSKFAMIGGAPFLMAPLEQELRHKGITPLYAFSLRESAEVPDGNGGVRKTQIFRHAGFVEGCCIE